MLRSLALSALTLMLAAPVAMAVGGETCAAVDVYHEYTFRDPGATSSEGATRNASDAEPGQEGYLLLNGEEHCEGAFVTLVVEGCVAGVYAQTERHELPLYKPRPHADFTFNEAYFDVPSPSYRITLWLGEERTGVLLDQGAGGPACLDPPATEPVCLELTAEALAEGGVLLTWNATADATGYVVMRDGAWLVALDGETTTFTDVSTQAGVTYTYAVRPQGGPGVSCGDVEVTAVPFFGSGLLGLVALAGVVGAYVALRRR